MESKENFISIIFRIVLTPIFLFPIFYLFDPFNALNREADVLNFLIVGLYMPFVITILTIAICSILAMPFWFSGKLNNWWIARPLLQIIFLALGILLLLVSLNSNFRETVKESVNGEIVSTSFVNEFISVPGWLMITLSILITDISAIAEMVLKKIKSGTDWNLPPDR